MNLFEPSAVDILKQGLQERTEPVFSYLATSGTPAAKVIRELMEQWFQDYPEEHQNELRQRFVTSKSDIDSPLFELALHATFRRVGAKVEIHPKVSEETDRRPDFLIQLPNGFEFYLEAVLARGQSDDERNRERVINSIYGLIDRKLKSPDYFWSVTVLSQGNIAPSGNQIVNSLAQYMRGLNREEVQEQLTAHGFDSPIKLRWEQDGWSFDFAPIPKSLNSIGNPNHRPLGVFPGGRAQLCRDDSDIRDAIKYKLAHHSNLDKPYIISVNATRWSAQREDFREAIYGSSQLIVTAETSRTTATEETRELNGIWLGKTGPKHQSLIAVLGTVKLHPWTIADSWFTMYENPYIDFPEDARVAELQRLEAKDGVLDKVDGQTIGKLFGLPENWAEIASDTDAHPH